MFSHEGGVQPRESWRGTVYLGVTREPLGLRVGHAVVRSVYLGDFRLELKGTDEAVKGADDEPVNGLLPEQWRASSMTSSGPTWLMLGGNEGTICQKCGYQSVQWGADGWRAILLRWLNWLVWWWWQLVKERTSSAGALVSVVESGSWQH